jgi:hypothetical protein
MMVLMSRCPVDTRELHAIVPVALAHAEGDEAGTAWARSSFRSRSACRMHRPACRPLHGIDPGAAAPFGSVLKLLGGDRFKAHRGPPCGDDVRASVTGHSGSNMLAETCRPRATSVLRDSAAQPRVSTADDTISSARDVVAAAFGRRVARKK